MANEISPGKTRIGWIGTGVMGRWMCRHLITKGYTATVYNRTKDKAAAAARHGAPPGPTRRSEVAPNVRRRVRHRRLSEGRARGVPRRRRGAGRQQGGHRARGHDDERAVAGGGDLRARRRRRASRASTRRFRGGDVGAKNAALSIMIGGDEDVVDAVQPILRAWARRSSTRAAPAPASTRRWSTRS